MRAPEKLSIGPLQAEGPRATVFLMILLAAVLGAAFYLGKLSALFDACFGLRPI